MRMLKQIWYMQPAQIPLSLFLQEASDDRYSILQDIKKLIELN